MPIKISDSLPARSVLESEGIFVMTEKRALSQDIRPLRLLILNLMPLKIATETQLLRCLSNTPLQIEVTLMQTSTYTSKNTPEEHLLAFYTTFREVREKRFDGMIITGAPVETLPFEDVEYWPELCQIMDWTCTHVYSTFHICWGAQAALYHHFGIPKHPLPAKLSGVFCYDIRSNTFPLLRGFDDTFLVPQSRYTEIREADLQKTPGLLVLASSPAAGVYLAATPDGRQVFSTGHPEYDADTLALEYKRDRDKGLPIAPPRHYYPQDDPAKEPRQTWRSHAHLLYSNWLNYCVYQTTPYDLETL